jgi:hypothetical protein
LVGDGFEGSGDFYSILCLLRGDEMEGMVDIFGCKLAGATSRGLWKVGAVFRANSGYGGYANAS